MVYVVLDISHVSMGTTRPYPCRERSGTHCQGQTLNCRVTLEWRGAQYIVGCLQVATYELIFWRQRFIVREYIHHNSFCYCPWDVQR